MENEDNKLAEEILAKFIEKLDYTYRYKTINERKNIINELRYLMQAYHEAKLKEVTDADFEEWASVQDFGYGAIYYIIKAGAKMGIKAMQNGEIKHNG